MMKNLLSYLNNELLFQNLTNELKNSCIQLVEELSTSFQSNEDTFPLNYFEEQLKKLFKILNTPAKLSVLTDANHRKLIIAFIKHGGIEHYKYSYYNRAKLSSKHIERLEEVGPILFSETVMIASKLNIINKNSSRNYIEDHLYTQSENPIDMRIQEILKLCDGKKRTINNNLKKMELILEGPDSLEVIKELGKMLRESWKKDKSKAKCSDLAEEIVKVQDTQAAAIRNENWDMEEPDEKYNEEDKMSFTSSQKWIMENEKEFVKLGVENILGLEEIHWKSGDYFDQLLDFEVI